MKYFDDKEPENALMNFKIDRIPGTSTHGTQSQGFDFDPAKVIIPKFRGNAGLQDAKRLISIYLSKGTKITQIYKKGTRHEKKELHRLAKKYDLKDSPVQDVQAVTLSRVAAGFPIFTVTILHYLDIEFKVRRDNFLFTGIKLPSEFSQAEFLCTIPLNKLSKRNILRLVAIVTVYAIKEAKMLNPVGYKDKSNLEIFQEIKFYLKKLMESSVRDENQNEILANLLTNIYRPIDEKLILARKIKILGEAAREFTQDFDLKFICTASKIVCLTDKN